MVDAAGWGGEVVVGGVGCHCIVFCWWICEIGGGGDKGVDVCID